MQPAEKSGFRGWIGRWGFAILVSLAALAAACVGWKVEVPSEVPDFALNAAAIYRVEVGAATFLGLYLVAMAFVLALNNRGFSEIGVHGLKAQDITEKTQRDVIQEHEESLEVLWNAVEMLEASTDESSKRNLLSPKL
jgi:hypothetical protein